MPRQSYDERAAEAETEAERAASPEEKSALLEVAALWRELAERAAQREKKKS
jgi:ferric-dicitrate binding protein FerR (iron transport regulator)